MRIARGSTAQRSNATLISWEEAAKRIRELLELGRYMPQSELDEVDHYERMRLADSIAYTSRDMTTEARNAGFLPLAMLAQSVKGGYPETQKQIYELLCAPDTLQKCVDEWTAFNAALDAGQDLLRFRFYRPKEILERLRDLQREPLHFTVADGFAPDRQFLFPPMRSTRCCVDGTAAPTIALAYTLFTPRTRIRPSVKIPQGLSRRVQRS